MVALRQLSLEHAELTARIHRESGALIPDYGTSLHTPAEDLEFHRCSVLVENEVWGAFDRDDLVAFIAWKQGWIDHLYVRPDRLRCGIGSQLVTFAQQQQSELRLFTFQSNARGRAFYEHHGFLIEEMTDGERNVENQPDITYLWRRV